MAERCSRTQCSAPATARVAFDALTCFVWIDPFDADGPLDVSARGAGALCARHADRLVAPRGWAVQDRRGRDLQLWSERPTSGAVAVPSTRALSVASRASGRSVDPARRGGRSVVVLEQVLPFDAVAEPPSGERTPLSTTAGDDIDVVLAAVRSPLLSRAFNAARTRHAG